jgi:hypothetical protein
MALEKQFMLKNLDFPHVAGERGGIFWRQGHGKDPLVEGIFCGDYPFVAK